MSKTKTEEQHVLLTECREVVHRTKRFLGINSDCPLKECMVICTVVLRATSVTNWHAESKMSRYCQNEVWALPHRSITNVLYIMLTPSLPQPVKKRAPTSSTWSGSIAQLLTRQCVLIKFLSHAKKEDKKRVQGFQTLHFYFFFFFFFF